MFINKNIRAFMNNKWWLEKTYWNVDNEQVLKNHMLFIEKQKGSQTFNFKGVKIHAYDGVYHPLSGSSTDVVYDSVIKIAKPGMRVLEMGTGSGAVALSLAEIGCHVTGVDIDNLAIDCAYDNATQLMLNHKTNFYTSDLFDEVEKKEDGKFDLVIFNPPLLHCEPMARDYGMNDRFDNIAIDTNGDLLKSFCASVSDFMNEGAEVCFLVSNIGNYDAILEATSIIEEKVGYPYCLYAQYRNSGEQWRFMLSAKKESR